MRKSSRYMDFQDQSPLIKSTNTFVFESCQLQNGEQTKSTNPH